jgi:L-threonylcarbamoyladenylate synthase
MQNNNFENDIKQCISILEAGGVILYPTDTIWGIGCDATNEAAVEKIFSIKQRTESKSLISLMPESNWLFDYCASPPIDIEDILIKYADKPTTIVLPNILHIAANALAEDGSMGIRICKETFCYALLKRFRKPIISTSANISGEPSPSNYSEVSDPILVAVDYCVNYKQSDMSKASSSRVIKWHSTNEIEIIRA